VADDIRDEAEKLVAAAIAAVSMAARSLGGPGSRLGGAFATGTPECCVCPVCRVVAAMRDPNPDLAEKLSAGAGELRTLSRGGDGRAHERDTDEATREGDEFWEALRRRARGGADEADPWHAATTSPPASTAKNAPPSSQPAKKAMAKKAVAKKVVPAQPSGTPAARTPAARTTAARTTAGPGAGGPAKAAPKKSTRPRETG
jgi:hypothetical protein